MNSQAYNTRNIRKEMNSQCYTCTNSTNEIYIINKVIILFSKNLKFSEKLKFKEHKTCKGN